MVGIADIASGCLPGQTGIASLVGFVDIGRTPSITSGSGARGNGQEDQDKSRSHSVPIRMLDGVAPHDIGAMRGLTIRRRQLGADVGKRLTEAYATPGAVTL
jgi:hypothetical protein